MKRILCVLILMIFGSTGCGALVHGTHQNISINSKPEGANVTVGLYKVKTPAVVSLSHSQEYVVLAEKEGYKPANAVIQQDFNTVATIFGNLLWFLPGVVVDVVSGGAWTLTPETINVELEPNAPQEKL